MLGSQYPNYQVSNRDNGKDNKVYQEKENKSLET